MTKGFKDSNGKFRPTRNSNNGISSNEFVNNKKLENRMVVGLPDILYGIDELTDLLVDLVEKQRALIKAVKAERKVTNWNEVIGVETNLDHLMHSIRNDSEQAITESKNIWKEANKAVLEEESESERRYKSKDRDDYPSGNKGYVDFMDQLDLD